MRAFGKMNKISMYAGDTTFDSSELLLKHAGEEGATVGVIQRIKNALSGVYHEVTEYLRDDLCRSAFLLCLCAVSVSAVVYNSGYSKKLEVQNYLIQLEAELEHERDTELLTRNIRGLDALLSAASENERPVNPQNKEFSGYIINIKSYFDRDNLGTIEKYYRDKVADLEKIFVFGPKKLSHYYGDSNAVKKQKKILVSNIRHDLSLLNDFAADQKNKSAEKIVKLEEDSRKALVGTVSRYNSMMDLSLLAGVSFLVLGIASVPGLGKHVKTGFV